MGADFNILGKGLKKLAILLLLLIASPILLTLSFKALSTYKEGVQYWISLLLLTISSLLMAFTLFFAFKTFRTILDSLFQDK